MKLGFVFDTIMLQDEKGDFYTITLNYELWSSRYLQVFDSIIVSTRVKVSTLENIKKMKGYTKANGSNVEMLPIENYYGFADQFKKRKQIIKELESMIKKVDKVIIRMPSVLGMMACDICKKYNKPYAIEMVACALDGYRNHGHWAGKIVAPYMYIKSKRACKRADRIVYVTEKFLQNRYPCNGICTNASNVNIKGSDNNVLDRRLRKIENMDTTKIKLGIVGNLTLKSKGHEVAFKAMAEIKDKYPNTILELLGDGDSSHLLKLAKKYNIEENICIMGTLPSGSPVLEWIDNINYLLIPSFQEGLPRILIEAMSRGCIAFGANTGGIPELIEPKYIHEAGDYKKLAKDVITAIECKNQNLKSAETNFEQHYKYSKERLDIKRRKFWEEFRNE